MHEFDVGDIGNAYGGLVVKYENGKRYWSITNYDGDRWQEIPEYLYDALAKFKDES